MKKLLILIPLLCAAALAHADLVIEQKIESAILNGNTTTKIKGEMARVDSPMPGGVGQMSTIVDLAKGKATTLLAAQKIAMVLDLGAILKAATSQLQGADAPKPKATGQTEKVGSWNADVYEFTAAGTPLKLWVSKDFPNAAALKAQTEKLTTALTGGAINPALYDLPGMVVKTEMTTPQGKMTTTMISVKEAPVADSEFVVPTDYQTMAAPTGN